VLTGVHERYLVHAVPLILLAERTGFRSRVGWLAGAWSGIFVLTTVHEHSFVGPLLIFTRPEPLALLQLTWLLALVLERFWYGKTAPSSRVQGL
jgi:hypothetical protein